MSQALKGGMNGAVAGTSPKAVGKPVIGQGAKVLSSGIHGTSQPQSQVTSNNALSSPMAGMPGVLPGSVLSGGHTNKPKGGISRPTPIVGSGASSMNGSHQQSAPLTASAGTAQATVVSAATASAMGGTGQDPSNQATTTTTPNPTVTTATEQPTTTPSLANTKEKTPMCLINELARFNKIQHQYTLTDEQGPAHKKVFFVKLTLGDEEYDANGQSIKKAQHAAAALAIECTKYRSPPPKPPRTNTAGVEEPASLSANPSITPTVELNALAMKLGQPAIYRPLEPARNAFYPPNMNFRGMYNQRYHVPRVPRMFFVSLKVGQREFIGEGNTRQSARHSAAEKALRVLSVLPITSEETAAATGSTATDDESTEKTEEEESESGDNLLKSEISLVHEIALKRNLQVNFEVIKESGPPHMKTFMTRCSCGTLFAEAEGNSKKLSKKRAAEKMMEQLQQLPAVPSATVRPKKPPNKKKNNRNLIKKADPDYGVGINPISRLIQIQQAKKDKEPVYTLLAEKGVPRRKEFVMQVSVGEQTCSGVGPNKKLAKRNAAEAMLQMLGYSRPSPQPSKSSIKAASPSDTASGPSPDKKVTFLEAADNPINHVRQLVPGVLMIPESPRAKSRSSPEASAAGGGVVFPSSSPQAYAAGLSEPLAVKYSPQTTAAIAKELLDTGASPTAESINKHLGARSTQVISQAAVRPKQQLLYLAEVLGFQVQFTDFPKSGKKSEYLSLASLTTNPPQVSHGSGTTIEASHDMAALNALKALSEMGLDSVGGDGAGDSAVHVKSEKPGIKSEAM